MVEKYINRARTLAFSSTAKDTYLMFVSNISTAFLGFVFTWILARGLDVSDFGIFSAASNLVFMLVPLVDVGVTAGLIRFVSSFESTGKSEETQKYVKAGFVTRLVLTFLFSIILIIFSEPISRGFLATTDPMIAVWVAIILVGMFFMSFFPFVFQAKRQFFKSAVVDVTYSVGRVAFALIFLIVGLTLNRSLASFALAGVVSFFVVWKLYGYSFLKVNVKKNIYKKLLGFSGWLGVNKVLSSIYSRTDVLLIASLVGATTTGYYSIASRLALFVVVLAASLSSVFSTRLAAFNDKLKEISYLKKSTLVLLPITAGILLWIVFARPFILLLFGEKYIESVVMFQYLASAMIPFLFTVPSVTAIIYAMKKPKYIGAFTVFQAILMVLLNYVFIKRFGAIGATFAVGIVNTLLALYSWAIVINHYKRR